MNTTVAPAPCVNKIKGPCVEDFFLDTTPTVPIKMGHDIRILPETAGMIQWRVRRNRARCQQCIVYRLPSIIYLCFRLVPDQRKQDLLR
jgi:hypothetical protein